MERKNDDGLKPIHNLLEQLPAPLTPAAAATSFSS